MYFNSAKNAYVACTRNLPSFREWLDFYYIEAIAWDEIVYRSKARPNFSDAKELFDTIVAFAKENFQKLSDAPDLTIFIRYHYNQVLNELSDTKIVSAGLSHAKIYRQDKEVEKAVKKTPKPTRPRADLSLADDF